MELPAQAVSAGIDISPQGFDHLQKPNVLEGISVYDRKRVIGNSGVDGDLLLIGRPGWEDRGEEESKQHRSPDSHFGRKARLEDVGAVQR